MKLPTPDKIRTLQRKLYRKAKQEPGFRFYALYDKVYRADILSHAYRLVKAKKGAPGVDGVTFKAIEAGQGAEAFLAEVGEALRERSYRAEAVRRVWLPKPDGGRRPLGIPTIRDRIVQMALKLVLEPIFEADFSDNSYGFRPGRSTKDAVDAVAGALGRGHTQVIDADLSKYFDTIPHAKLLAMVAERVSDGGVLSLIKQWLKAPVVEEDKDGTKRGAGGGKGNRRGTPQGGVISPLLANLYLHILDRIWDRHGLARRYQAKLVRYADDAVILCKRGTGAPLQMLRKVLGRLDLELNEAKTHIVDARHTSFDFLGFSCILRQSRKSGKFYPHVEPSKRSAQRLQQRVKSLLARKRTAIPIQSLIGCLNEDLRGWSGYFHYRNSSKAFGRMKWYVEETLRNHLRKRHKHKGRAKGYQEFPTAVLYQRYGLFKLPTTAGWRTAHAKR